MFTVTFGLDGSGNRSTLRPFGYWYSVMPPMVAFFSTPCGNVCEIAEPATAATINRTLGARMFLLIQLHHAKLPPIWGETACQSNARWWPRMNTIRPVRRHSHIV